MAGFSTVIIALLLLHVACAFYIGGRNGNFPSTRRKQSTRELFSVRLDDVKIQSDSGRVLGPRTTLENYQHKNFTLSYLYKAASPGREKDKPIVLIHPVGIGLSSWFWTKLMDSYEDNPPIYAPDLIGCGIDHGSDEWNPNEAGLFFPLSWVEGIETLMQSIVVPRWQQQSSWTNIFSSVEKNTESNGCLVIAQGGLAPVGIMLAKRNPLMVGSLMLTSPPTYADMTTPVPEKELQSNFDFLRSPILGSLAFSILESKGIIRFFSNLFLFANDCDEQWLDETQRELCPEARPPVQAFNAGLLQHRSFEEELKGAIQPKIIVSGDGDKRSKDRQPYESELDQCTLKTVKGLNVMPWENSSGMVNLIREIGY